MKAYLFNLILFVTLHLKVLGFKKEDALLYTVYGIGVLFWLFWIVLFWKTFKLKGTSKEIDEMDKTFTTTQKVTYIAALLSIVILVVYVIYSGYHYYYFLEAPAQGSLFMLMGIVSFGLTPYAFRKVFYQMKNVKSKQGINTNVKKL